MNISGLQKLSLVDWPGKAAATLFTGGCNYRCPFCHNYGLASDPPKPMDEEEVFAYLAARRKLLDGVVVSGGEPLLHPDAPKLLERIKALGCPVKLDTNGCFPDRLEQVLKSGLVDYVAMDIKNSPAKYAMTAGAEPMLGSVRRSAELLMSGNVDFEFRTTVVAQLHDIKDFTEIGRWLAGNEKYYLQRFRDSEAVPFGNFTPPSDEQMAAYRAELGRFVTKVYLRGE